MHADGAPPPLPPPLPAVVSGERFEFNSPAGRLSAYTAGQGPPLLLVHSINASGSAAEWRRCMRFAAPRARCSRSICRAMVFLSAATAPTRPG